MRLIRTGSSSTKWTSSQLVLLALITLFAVAIRVEPLVIHPDTQRGGLGQFGDTYGYHRIAANLLRGNGYSATYDGSAFGGTPQYVDQYKPAITRAPGYPFFLASVYSFVGKRDDTSADAWRARWDAARLAQCVLDALVCVLVFFFARAIAPEFRWAPLAAAAIYAVSPYNIFYTRALLSESVTTFLVTAGLLAYATAFKRYSARLLWVGVGLLMGVTALCRPEFILFPFLVGGSLMIVKRANRRERFRIALCCVGGAFIGIAPWTVRNIITFHEVIPVSVGSLGYQTLLGSYETPENWKGWDYFPEDIFPSEQERAQVGAQIATVNGLLMEGSIQLVDADRPLRKLAIEKMLESPGRTIDVWIDKIPRLWFQNYIPMYRDREASGIFLLAFLALGAYAAFRAHPSERMVMLPVGLLALYLTIIFLPLHVEARYSVTAIPGLIGLAGVGLCRLTADVLKTCREEAAENRKPFKLIREARH